MRPAPAILALALALPAAARAEIGLEPPGVPLPTTYSWLCGGADLSAMTPPDAMAVIYPAPDPASGQTHEWAPLGNDIVSRLVAEEAPPGAARYRGVRGESTVIEIDADGTLRETDGSGAAPRVTGRCIEGLLN